MLTSSLLTNHATPNTPTADKKTTTGFLKPAVQG